MFMVILCVQFYRLTQLVFSTLLKVIIRKECQSFTNHGHAKTPPTVFNPLSLWLTLPLDMGVSHTPWPPSITRAILACLWLAQGLHRVCTGTKNQNSRATHACPWFAQGISPNQNSFQGHYPQRMPIIYKPRTRCVQFYRLTQLVFSTLLKGIIRKNANHLQTTDTLKRHQQYSIHYHCG